jgi:hypothetical protein
LVIGLFAVWLLWLLVVGIFVNTRR